MYKSFLLVFVVSFFSNAALAQSADAIVPAPPQGNATAYLLMDYHSGEFLAEKNIDEQVEPASLTKMMTAYVAGEELEAGHIKLEDQVLVSEKAWRMPGSRMFIEVNTQVSVDDLLKGI
ncbi:MAG: serine hydrolase, partial [Gammaproteobacteria bacterium]